jgi:hypothetical protein
MLMRNGVVYYTGVSVPASADSISFLVHNSTGFVGTVPSFALANTDQISFMLTYRVE